MQDIQSDGITYVLGKEIVLLDACVLYSAVLRDLLMQLTSDRMFRARWTQKIQAEWSEKLLKNNPTVSRENVSRTLWCMDNMDTNQENRIITGYDHLIDELALPDANDRHVLAAAIRGQATIILTYNTRDFPEEYVLRFGIKIRTPDNFLVELLTLNTEKFCAAIRTIRSRLRKPRKLASEYLDSLAKQRIPKTVSVLRNNEQFL